ncbi:hypothetical protein [Vibrio fluvialis]|uniref:hypothetical protein n=1 Tax=Vibrio fluvialis TaxID=676 RepID=UPI001ABD9F1C|nr:hypothetical protein [Vibrio fluvialis]QTH11577.1 hypothetical protein JTJ03_17350 [Vibrio fluvialis]
MIQPNQRIKQWCESLIKGNKKDGHRIETRYSMAILYSGGSVDNISGNVISLRCFTALALIYPKQTSD